MANILTKNVNDPSLTFVQPQYSGFQNAKAEYTQNSILSNNVVKVGLLGFGLDLLRRVHNDQLERNPNYLKKLNTITHGFEEYSPYRMGRTFGFGDRLAALNAGIDSAGEITPLLFSKEHLVNDKGILTSTGKHFQRLFGDRFDVTKTPDTGLSFTRANKSSKYLSLDLNPNINVQFTRSKGVLAGVSYRNRKPLNDLPVTWSKSNSLTRRFFENAENIKKSQIPGTHPGSWGDLGNTQEFLPYHATFAASEEAGYVERGYNRTKNILSKVDLFALEAFERPQKLLAETLRVGVKQGSYNRAFTIPGFARAGEKGLLNETLLKRVLPVAVGLTALKYADYLTGHKISNALVDIPLKLNVARAELTDRLPGARKVTDAYENTVPGPQYGPLALPLFGGFIGGLYHYSKVVNRSFIDDEARKLSSKLLPDLKQLKNIKDLSGLKTGLKTAWSSLGRPGKGVVFGLAAMLPFIPGMLGSRKNAGELRDIYSGEENVPVRSGRWWSLGCQIDTNTHLTNQGMKTVQEIYENRDIQLLNDQGQFETPSDWMRYEHNGPVYKISLNYSDVKLSFTPNHLFPVRRNGELLELRADELVKGDYLLTNRLTSDESLATLKISNYIDGLLVADKISAKQINWFTKNVQRSGKAFNNIINCNYNFGFLLGHFMAEGNLNSNERGDSGVEHTGDVKELATFNLLNNIYEEIFGYKGTIKTKNNTIKLRVSGTIISKFFRALLFKNNVKLLDYNLLTHLPSSCLIGILEGWFYGDGCLESSRASIKTKYKQNALIIKKLFSKFGVASSITSHESLLNGILYPGFKVTINLEGLNTLNESIVNLHKHYHTDISTIISKTYGYQVYETEIAYRIKNIEIVKYNGYVYDFEVSSNHHYETESCITHNSSAFGGGRIESWRPHWSVIFKSRAQEKSLYGSEGNAWSHNALLHPIKALTDPYYLENLHYKDRPYPISSPAFSNVPLIGPLLAATVGRLVKPPKRMHEDEFDDADYNMYSTRLNPKGPQVESKFERDVLKDLSQKGYAAQTQVKAGDYRIDFVLQGKKGNKVAIETDGETYHTQWNAKADAERQAKLEKLGWDFIHIRSSSYFNDPNKTMNKLFNDLQSRGITPTGNIDRDTSSGLVGLAPPKPKEEFGLFNAIKEEGNIFADYIGLPGYVAKTLFNKIFPDKTQGQEAFLQGSRQIDSLSRSYYESNLGEGLGPNLGESGAIGYTEPIRRFIQRDPAGIQANDIKNTMPSWLPGEDYLVNFKTGDPFTKLDYGFARLPGAGFEATHPEVAGLNPEDYPDMTKLSILSDVAPYSREFNIIKDRLGKSIGDNTEERIKYEKLVNQANETKKSILQVDKRRFTGDIENIQGTVKAISSKGIELNEFPGRTLKYSSLGMSAADLSAVVLGQQNNLTRSEVAKEVNNRQRLSAEFLSNKLKPGTKINAVVPLGATQNSENISAVINVDGQNLNKELIDKGYAQYNKSYGGAESQALFGDVQKAFGTLAETLSFDLPKVAPAPYHTKLWQERTAYDQYISQEVIGTRMRRWDRPFDDFASPYARAALNKATGIKVMAESTIQRRDLNTLVDQLKYLRGLHNIAEDAGDEYTRDIRRTNIGTNLLASPVFVASTIPDRDKRYFQPFLAETDPSKREDILAVSSPELAKTLQAQWAAADARIQKASGKNVEAGNQGRVLTEANLEEYSKAKTKLGYGDYLRSQEVANFFSRTGFALPESSDDPIFSNNLDYEDVKLKIIQNEGYDAHDFNIFDDRTAMLWRKPYVDGAVASLTTGNTSRSGEQLRRSVEQLMLQAQNKNPNPNVLTQASHVEKNSVRININIDEQEKVMKDIRRNPEDYKD